MSSSANNDKTATPASASKAAGQVANPYSKAKKTPSPKITPSPKMSASPPDVGGAGSGSGSFDTSHVGKSDGEFNTRALGLSKSTQAGRVSALSKFNIYLDFIKRPLFQDMSKALAEGDGMVELLSGMVSFFARNPLPKDGFTWGFEPVNPDSKKIWLWESIKQDCGRIMNCCREKFPDLDCWPSKKADSPGWFKDILDAGEKEWNRKHQDEWKNNPLMEFSSMKTKPVYKRFPIQDDAYPSEELLKMSQWYQEEIDASKGEWMDCKWVGVVLHTMLRRMFIKASPICKNSYMDIFMVLWTYNQVNRGGELRRSWYLDWDFNHYLEALVDQKNQQKVLEVGMACPMVWNPKDPILCPMFVWFCYFLMDGGATRTNLQATDKLENAVLPEHYNRESSAFSRTVTTALSKGLPATTPDDIRATVSAKSLRQGAISELHAHEFMDYTDICARSGHSTGTNMEKYRNIHDPTRSLKAAKILSDHPSLHQTTKMPKPWYLDSRHTPEFKRLVKYLLDGVHVQCFQAGGHLHRFFQYCVCLHILWFNDLQEQYGMNNGYVSFWMDLVKRINLRDPEDPSLSPVQVLEQWSFEISEVNKVKTNVVSSAGMGRHTAQDLLMQQEATLNSHKELMKKFDSVTEQSKESEKELKAAMLECLKKCYAECRSTRALVEKIEQQRNTDIKNAARGYALGGKKTPTPVPSFSADDDDIEVITEEQNQAEREQRKQRTVINQNQTITNNNSNVFISNTSGSNSPSDEASTPLRDVSVAIVTAGLLTQPKLVKDPVKDIWGTHKKRAQRVEAIGTKGALDMWCVLEDLHTTNWFSGHKNQFLGEDFHSHQRSVPKHSQDNKSAFYYSMELLQYVCTKDEALFLKTEIPKDTNPKKYHSFYTELSKKMMAKLDEFEGEDYLKRREEDKVTPGQKVQATVSAMGSRVKKYKNKINETLRTTAPKLHRVDMTPLRDPSQLNAEAKLLEGTPPGNTSMLDFYGKRAGAQNNKAATKKQKLDSVKSKIL